MPVVRYGIPAAMILAGIVILIVAPGPTGVEGFGMAAGGGLAVLLLNFLFRLGVSGDREREQEEQARAYFDEHGVWPDEAQARSGRRWTLPAGVRTLEHEEAEKARRRGH